MSTEMQRSMSRRITSSNSSNNSSLMEEDRKVSIHISSSSQRMSSGPRTEGTGFSPRRVTIISPPGPKLDMIKNMSRSPEQRLALVALRLAVLEKAATGLGKVAFVWATVVLLGGYVTNLKQTDFWIVAMLLLTEGSRVFSRSSELEWQQANYSLGIVHVSSLLFDKSTNVFSKVIINSHRRHEQDQPRPKKDSIYQGFGAKRTWSWSAIPFIPYVHFISTKTVSLILYFLQLASAGVSIGFALWRLIRNDFRVADAASDSADTNNSEASLKLFYALMLGEASLFLVERAYWEYKLRFRKLLEEVNRKCQLGQEDLETMKQYYYAVYSRCLNGSVFDGLDLDLVTFSAQKMQSSVRDEQLGSIQILATLASKGVSREETRRRIGTTPGVVQRLLEMTTWKDLSDKEIRKAATLVLRHLVRLHSNCFSISAIPGSLEGIVSLLGQDADEEKVDGLSILKELAKDHRTCVRIGNTSGVVSILVGFIRLETSNFKNERTRKVFKKSLQLLKMMANTGGESGHSLRKKIASVVFSIRNLKEILEQGGEEVDLQTLSVEILTSLANDDELRECIGATGGVIRQLVLLLTTEAAEGSKERAALSVKAGEAISLLALQSPRNCTRILNHKPYKDREENVSGTLTTLISMLSNPHICTEAAMILRSLCKCLNDKEKREMAASVSQMVSLVLESSSKAQQAAVGLAAAVIPMVDKSILLSHRDELVAKMVELVSEPVPPSLNRKRRYSVELLNALMTRDKSFVKQLRSQGVELSLERILETASDVENFYTFSGTVGLTRHSKSLEQLVNEALVLLHS